MKVHFYLFGSTMEERVIGKLDGDLLSVHHKQGGSLPNIWGLGGGVEFKRY